MTAKKLISADDVLARQMDNPAFRRRWEETSLARSVALEVVRHRVGHDLSQAALAKRLGVSQPVIARLESGDHTPTWVTLARLSKEMGVHFVVDVDPDQGAPLREVS